MKRFYILIAFALTIFMGCKNETEQKDNARTISEVKMSSINVLPDDTIQSPFTLEVSGIDNWSAWEGELGSVHLLDASGKEIGMGILSSKDGDWMTNKNAVFTTQLVFDSAASQKGTLVFKNKVISEAEGDVAKSVEIPVTILPSNSGAASYEEEGYTYYYFGEETVVNYGGEIVSSFQLMKFKVAADNKVLGYKINAPYGTDGSRSNYSGVFNPEENSIEVNETTLAEGEIYKNESAFVIKNNTLFLEHDTHLGTQATLPEITNLEFNTLQNKYESVFGGKTQDRNRLKKIAALNGWNFTPKALESLRYKELLVNVDNNYKTQEYLLYVMDDQFCGSGGCNLFLINNSLKIISTTTVVKLPIYNNASLASTIGGNNNIIVWSNGAYRTLNHGQAGYPSNASVAPVLDNQDIEFHPQRYVKVLDY